MNLNEQIINTTIELFNEYGYKFRIDDITNKLFISKKTIYNIFGDKEQLFMELLKYCGTAAKKEQEQIVQNKELDYPDKVRHVLALWPDRFRRLNQKQLIALKLNSPKMAKKVGEYYKKEWEMVEEILTESMLRGSIIRMPTKLIRSMLEGTLENFVLNSNDSNNAISYEDAKKDTIRVIMNGIELIEY
ncbi:MAG: TetR/AcrR family transcriptional regulator [Lachnospiraceae bacterium]|nr:TetR/AcrR family transcriptional regulator [Lachnospiraceae bacterium]